MSATFIKKIAYAQAVADHQKSPVTFSYQRRHPETGDILKRGEIILTPGEDLIGPVRDRRSLDEITDQILDKYKSAINGHISCFSSVMRLEKDIAAEITKLYRETLKAPDPNDVAALERMYSKSDRAR